LKDDLIKLAKDPESIHVFLDAGRGNPNWIAATPREAYFLFGRFGIEESKRMWHEPDLGGMPKRDGIGARFDEFAKRYAKEPGAQALKSFIDYSVNKLKFDKDSWVHELADAIIGDMHLVPMRMGRQMEQVARAYLVREMCGDSPPPGTYDIFALEGGTAAMC
jgi:aspartate 4-decarboxylase